MSQDDGGPLKIQTVQGCSCYFCWDPLSTRTLHKIKNLQQVLWTGHPGHPHHLTHNSRSGSCRIPVYVISDHRFLLTAAVRVKSNSVPSGSALLAPVRQVRTCRLLLPTAVALLQRLLLVSCSPSSSSRARRLSRRALKLRSFTSWSWTPSRTKTTPAAGQSQTRIGPLTSEYSGRYLCGPTRSAGGGTC